MGPAGQRAIIAMASLGTNLPEDAIYPLNLGDSDGKPLSGANTYVLSFTKEQLPPVDAFWSVTLYDDQGFQVANPLNRFAISSWMLLQSNPDGSLDLSFQHDSPGADREANWLPTPASGNFYAVLRIDSPDQSVLDGAWHAPAMTPVSS